MDQSGWYQKRNDRTLRYADRVLPQDRPILIRLSEDYAGCFDGQVAVLVAANLLARMTPCIAFDVPNTDVIAPLPWSGKPLRQHLLDTISAADPLAKPEFRAAHQHDYILSLGREASAATVHGSGWNAYVGTGASPLPVSRVPNPIGPALAVTLAIARLFALDMKSMDGPYLFNGFDWRSAAVADSTLPFLDLDRNLGSIWIVGLGSVGTAVLYFLTLATRHFVPALFDMDYVKVENLDRSPIFTAEDADERRFKAEAAEL